MKAWLAAGFLAPGLVLSQPTAVPAEYSQGHAIGDRVQDLSFVGVDGRTGRLSALKGRHGVVLVTRDAECPVSQRYLARINELAKRYRARGFNFAVIDVTPHTRAQAKVAAKVLSGVRSLVDNDKVLVTGLRSASTAEAFVIDSRSTLRYRGAIDDQYGLDFQRERPRANWLTDALDSIANGETPHVTRTDARGCPLATAPGFRAVEIPITYHNRVSRIIQSNCQVCHRVGGLGPMPLENYRQVLDRRPVIGLMVKTGRMPPWSAANGVGEWANERRLSERDRADLLRWIEAGGPEGDPGDAPLSRKFDTKWNIGKPDAIIHIPEPVRVPAQGTVAYKYFYASTGFGEDKWVTAVEIKPTQPKVVHHVIALIEPPGGGPQDTANGLFAVTVPGSLGIAFPPGTGKKIPRGSRIKFELHYQPNGAEVIDRTQIGLRFATKEVQEVEGLSALNTSFAIPPNNPKYEVRAEHVFREPGQLLSLFPHMHLRGTAFRYNLILPNGRKQVLLDVPKFDFNWQSYYEFRQPQAVPAGAKLEAVAWYDNSKGNAWNPDPTQTVRWGQQTYEEMMIGYFDFIRTVPAR